PNGLTLLTTSFDGTARLWEMPRGRVRQVVHHQNLVNAGAFSPGGDLLVTAGEDGSARLWEIRPEPESGMQLPHKGSVRRLAFSPDGTRILTGSSDKTARIWDAATGQPVTAPLRHQHLVLA